MCDIVPTAVPFCTSGCFGSFAPRTASVEIRTVAFGRHVLSKLCFCVLSELSGILSRYEKLSPIGKRVLGNSLGLSLFVGIYSEDRDSTYVLST